MSPWIAPLVARVHGHLGWLAVAALAHPAWLLRVPGRRAPAATLASTSLVCFTTALGLAVYGPYRRVVRRSLFEEHPTLGWMFERKEHLAVGATCLAVVGVLAHLARPGSPALEGVSRRAYRLAFALALVAAALGTVVSSARPLASE